MNAALKQPVDWSEEPTGSPRDTIFTARIRPQDKERIHLIAGLHQVPVEVAAGVIADMGEASLRGRMPKPSHPNSSAHVAVLSLWGAINRTEAEYTETVPVIFPDGSGYDHEFDAWQLRRDIDDWLGSLIRAGLEALALPGSIAAYLGPNTMERMLFKGVAHEASEMSKPKKLGIPAAISVAYREPISATPDQVPVLKVKMQVPESIATAFTEFFEKPRYHRDALKGNDAFLYAFQILIKDRNDPEFHRPFNERHCGPSDKGRLQKVRKIQKSDTTVNVCFLIRETKWADIKAQAAAYGISPEDRILICLYYYAAILWKQQEKDAGNTGSPKPSAPTPFKSFERALSNEAKAAKAAEKNGTEP